MPQKQFNRRNFFGKVARFGVGASFIPIVLPSFSQAVELQPRLRLPSAQAADKGDDGASDLYLKLSGTNQGVISGSVLEPGLEGSIRILGFSHEISSPRDAASGLPTGKRMHRPFTIIKEIDCSTPLLHKLLVNNENIQQWELMSFRMTSKGKREKYYAVNLFNASVIGVNTEVIRNERTGDEPHQMIETVSFSYRKINWTYFGADGPVIAEDDWESPVS